MSDQYAQALKKFRSDKRSLNELEKVIGLPAETLRDIKRRISKFPRYDTIRRIARYYQESA